MKKYLFSSCVILLLSCDNNKTPASPEAAPNTTNVQNVNGNQPDTSSGITLDSRGQSDSSNKDSLPH